MKIQISPQNKSSHLTLAALAFVLAGAQALQAQILPASSGATSSTHPWFSPAGERSEFSLEYFWGTQDQRPIKLEAAEYSWNRLLGHRLELQRRLGVVHAQGHRTDTPAEVSPTPVANVSATGVTAGFGLRIDLVDFGPLHVSLDGSAQLLWTPSHPFPPGGTGLNGFERWGGSIAFDIDRDTSLVASYLAGHISNGSGVTAQNPMWNGRGVGLAVRFKF